MSILLGSEGVEEGKKKKKKKKRFFFLALITTEVDSRWKKNVGGF